jgi:hypothetical protein
MGTFLFAVKTFIVIKLKEDIFDRDFYGKRLENLHELNPEIKIEDRYVPLKRLTSVLFYASIIALSSSILQITVGLFKPRWCSIICTFAAFLSAGLLFWAMILVKRNLNVWMDDLEAHGAKGVHSSDNIE